jgi:CheY-like chemotaxis protein
MTVVTFPIYVNDHNTMTSSYHYRYSCDNFKSMSDYGSHNSKYYDQLVTKIKLQAKDRYERSLLQNQTASSWNKTKRILLVDDEPDICMIYQLALEDAGYQCSTYTDPVQALQEFKPAYYDLILLDIKMPVLNGFELCKEIREIDKRVHIIFITASEAYYEKFRGQHFPELGKINYIQKPIENDELVQIVNTIIGNSIAAD